MTYDLTIRDAAAALRACDASATELVRQVIAVADQTDPLVATFLIRFVVESVAAAAELPDERAAR
jgi:Asp-tRNA(Asn)/Glu-tRNA(Gln) amidotransferase A subunit family amidase